MKTNKWITLLVLITIGGIFNGCASIDKLNQLTTVYNESKGKIQDLRLNLELPNRLKGFEILVASTRPGLEASLEAQT